MLRVRVLLVGVLLAAITVYGGYYFFERTGEAEVKIGYLRGDLHQLALFVALEKGMFEEAGIKVSTVVYSNGVEMMDGFAAGEIDYGYLGIAPVILKSVNAGVDVRVLAAVNLEGSALIGRQDIPDLPMLEGSTIAIPGFGTVQDVLLSIILSDAGISRGNVNIVRLHPWDMTAALESGSIDAFIAWEPYPTKALRSGVGRLLAYSGDVWPSHPCCVVACTGSFYTKRRDLIRQLLEVHLRATEWIHKNPRLAAEIGAKYTGMSVDDVMEAMSHIRFIVHPNVDEIVVYVEQLKKLGYIEGEASEILDSLLDLSILEEVESES